MATTTTIDTAKLSGMKLPELWKLYAEVLGEDTRCPNKTFLVRKITEAVEARSDDETTGTEERDGAGTDERDCAAPNRIVRPCVAYPEPGTPSGISVACEACAQTIDRDDGERVEEPADDELYCDRCGALIVGTEEDEGGADSGTDAAFTDIEAADEGDAAEGDGNGTDGDDDEADADDKPFSRMTLDELRARYLEVVGRPTKGNNKRYIIWRIREAQKGRVKVGPLERRGGETKDMMVLPLRMGREVVEQLDAAWKRMGHKNRMAFTWTACRTTWSCTRRASASRRATSVRYGRRRPRRRAGALPGVHAGAGGRVDPPRLHGPEDGRHG